MGCRLQQNATQFGVVDADPLSAVTTAVEQGEDAMFTMVDRQTSKYELSPLVSMTSDLRLAQLFSGRQGETIYEIEIPAYRLIKDPFNTGTKRWAPDTEFFALGQVLPEEIRAYKLNNEDRRASELLFMRDNVMWEAGFLTDMTTVPMRTEPNPIGIWARK